MARLGGSMQKNKGFTLIELMVVIAIIAIVAMVAAPSFIEFLKAYKLNQAKEQIYQALKEGRSKAAANRAFVIVCPSKVKDGDEISVDKCLANADVPTAGKQSFKDSNRVVIANLATGVKVSGDTYFVFGPTGTSLDSVSNKVPKAKKIVVCSEYKTKEIEVTVLGSVSLKNSGVCS